MNSICSIYSVGYRKRNKSDSATFWKIVEILHRRETTFGSFCHPCSYRILGMTTICTPKVVSFPWKIDSFQRFFQKTRPQSRLFRFRWPTLYVFLVFNPILMALSNDIAGGFLRDSSQFILMDVLRIIN